MRRRNMMGTAGGSKWWENYLTIEALEDGLTVTFYPEVEYSYDGKTWATKGVDELIYISKAGQKVALRAELVPVNYGIGLLQFSKRCNLLGNCMSLLYKDDAANNTSVPSNAFYGLFKEATTIVSVSKTFLPATTLGSRCYQYMFEGCSSLINAPELPATTLATYCYNYMFHACTSLVKAPDLPATTLATYCYNGMFYACTSLVKAPDLPATTLAASCYQYMFHACTSLTVAPELPATVLSSRCYQGMFSYSGLITAPELPATTLDTYCYDSMFDSCESLTTAPESLPATTLAKYCYTSMFVDCCELKKAPVLPATKLVTSCYSNMFTRCVLLRYVKAMFTTTPSSSYTYNWLVDVYSSGTFVKNKNATWDVTGAHGIPSGWTVLTE